ncbi:Spo0B domain-containing protein [Alkalicoccobacillus porphyridii]|uniref:Sporulation initiation phosphotransferase B C-terminal domain-containing protein n=1 Tax=Alkalicoccobacillus porphyridii TaxID=2597270 RepID=A0A553ZWC4_9BACI|nr:Spo0B domain-containing protein [Alkalicoccobacillus porphyridii]TSB45771.1 hypothetical protein FN960_14900 [Alkalicoccobacillus porphyridii]
MSKHEDIILALKHTRHDWLNVIQLIKGNLALGHYERIEDIIQQTTDHSLNESKLFNISAPELTLFLIGYNWSSQKVKLSYHVEGEEFTLTDWDQRLLNTFKAITDILSNASSLAIENSLLISFTFYKNDFKIMFEYAGKTDLKESNWDDAITNASKDGIRLSLLQQTEYECILSILINES